MQEQIEAATLALPAAPLYVVVAIFVAIAAMTAADVRDKGRLLPNSGVNAMALTLSRGIVDSRVAHHNRGGRRERFRCPVVRGGCGDDIAHCLVLVLLLVIVSIWYWAVAIYKETPAGMPTNPATDS